MNPTFEFLQLIFMHHHWLLTELPSIVPLISFRVSKVELVINCYNCYRWSWILPLIIKQYRWFLTTVPLTHINCTVDFLSNTVEFFIILTVDFCKDYRWSRISTVDLHILPSIANDGTDDINQLYRWFQNQLYRWSVPLIFVVVPLFWYFVTAGFSPFLYRWSKSTVQPIKSLVPLIWNQR